MKNILWIGIAFFLLSFSCDVENELATDLMSLEDQINRLSESVSCTNSSEWKFTAMGSKPCGGPARYIAYHQSVEKDFLELVNQYTEQQKAYNQKTGAISDCAIVSPPRSVMCEGGKAFLLF
ncbi:hypothetical protein [Algoriphagus mannitolivorans]|uniref:hypothetical protein n=1 Tax=Algoriphagus mannitolivorans TaxID=226504 RepID=UPI000688624E|nr:hypothetical protein [Algoriphagus mannitolivorans]